MFFVSSFLLPTLSVLAMGMGIGWWRERGGAGMMQAVSRSCAREGEKRAAVPMHLDLESTLMHACRQAYNTQTHMFLYTNTRYLGFNHLALGIRVPI